MDPLEFAPISLTQVHALREMKLNVIVEMGTLQLSAEDLLDLVPGRVFEFEFDPARPVTLTVGTEAIGTAKLILHEGKLALEMLSVRSLDAEEQNSQMLDNT